MWFRFHQSCDDLFGANGLSWVVTRHDACARIALQNSKTATFLGGLPSLAKLPILDFLRAWPAIPAKARGQQACYKPRPDPQVHPAQASDRLT